MTPAIFAHGHLRLYLLSLLGERNMHGYELIQALEEKFGGTYVPSAGTIYPRLAKLEEEGLVTKSPEGRKTVYALTDAGRAELEARQHELSGIENDVTDSVRRLADEVRSSVNEAMKSLRADLAAAAREARDDAKAAGRTIRAESVRGSSNNHMHEVEIILTRFRHDLRSELRSRAIRGQLTAETVESLKAQLDVVRASL
jgi:DNA-binding PadR family transcriptional regulator